LAKLTLEQMKSRLKFDYLVAMKMRSPVMNVTAYRSNDDLEKRRSPIVNEDQGHLATHYLVDYFIRTLVGPDRYSEKTSVKFDLLADGNYPYTVPGRIVVDSELPWSPHFAKKLPICVDEPMWMESRGTMLLGDLLVHVAKLLNFDEVPRGPHYGGYNPEAVEYWRARMNYRPINPELHYPVLPESLINNIRNVPKGLFEADSISTDLFEISPGPAASGMADLFAPVEPSLFEPDSATYPGYAPLAPGRVPQVSASLFEIAADVNNAPARPPGEGAQAGTPVSAEFFPKPNP
jgi:hypothetical protein